jgi:phage-related holin
MSVKTLSHSTVGVTTGVGITAAVVFSPVQKGLAALFFFVVADFITGIIASYFKKKKAELEDPKLKEQGLISSDKLKMSLVKISTYFISILGCWLIESVFFIKKFSFKSISDQELTITLVCIAFCCVIEFWSIVMENFKEMGFDIRKKSLAVIKGIKNINKQVKE